jgi:hypothetical protein
MVVFRIAKVMMVIYAVRFGQRIGRFTMGCGFHVIGQASWFKFLEGMLAQWQQPGSLWVVG